MMSPASRSGTDLHTPKPQHSPWWTIQGNAFPSPRVFVSHPQKVFCDYSMCPMCSTPHTRDFLYSSRSALSLSGPLPHKRIEPQIRTLHSIFVPDTSQSHRSNLCRYPTTKVVLIVQFPTLVHAWGYLVAMDACLGPSRIPGWLYILSLLSSQWVIATPTHWGCCNLAVGQKYSSSMAPHSNQQNARCVPKFVRNKVNPKTRDPNRIQRILRSQTERQISSLLKRVCNQQSLAAHTGNYYFNALNMIKHISTLTTVELPFVRSSWEKVSHTVTNLNV